MLSGPHAYGSTVAWPIVLGFDAYITCRIANRTHLTSVQLWKARKEIYADMSTVALCRYAVLSPRKLHFLFFSRGIRDSEVLPSGSVAVSSADGARTMWISEEHVGENR